MSHPNRGLGRAGRGAEGKKHHMERSSRLSPPLGRSGTRPVPSTSKSMKLAGDTGPGFSGKMDVELASQVAKVKIEPGTAGGGGGDDGGNGRQALGRGSYRGRRTIAVVDVVKTKPQSCETKQGDFGTPIQLLTNYFKLETVTDWAVYQYRVDFNVQEERESVLRGWLREHKDKLSTAYIFDGTMLFTFQRLTPQNQPLELTSFREPDRFLVQITIKLVQQLNYGNAVYLQIFNILVRRCLLHLDLHLVNRNYYDPKLSIPLPQHSLEIWPGYITSIRQHEQNILMCTEISHKVMRTDTALKLLAECTKESGDYRRIFQQAMIGSIVLTDYNNKTYRIDDVDFSLTPQSSFLYKNNEQITYVKYYQQRYQLRITDMRQPLLISRATARDIRAGKDKQCLLVPELCRMTGLSAKMLDNRNLMKDFADITRIAPQMRIDRLRNFNKRLLDEPKVVEDFKQWGMTLSREMMSVTGRVFPQEKMIAGKNNTYNSGPDVDWTRSMRSTPMLLNGRFDRFVIICPTRLRREVEEFYNNLRRAASGMDFHIPSPIVVETKSDAPYEMIDAIERAACQHNPDLIMLAFTNDRGDRYSAVKKKCYVDRAIPSQVILSKSMKSKGVLSIATKVAVQINCKLGGAPWSVVIPTEHVMVIGYDVCHDKAKRGKSVGAVVASLNKPMSAWFSTASQHADGQELSNTLAMDVCRALNKYREVNSNILPQRIFFYRDGVGEGQIHHVYNHEVVAIKEKLTEIYGNQSWKLAYIIVTKRINTRFFAQSGNPRPGTIVDDVVTLPEKYDFYLVSQSVRQGTVSPTSYNVISDNLDWGANYIQRFTYKMTHLYYNSSATIQVPAPCQYAHKLAFMVSQNLGTFPNPGLNSRLYFL